jgi:hypothetical protein
LSGGSIQADYVASLRDLPSDLDALRAFVLACQSEHTLRRLVTPHSPNALASNAKLPGSGVVTNETSVQYPEI